VNAQTTDSDYHLASTSKEGAILQAWNWSFDTIKRELPEIAKAGYTTVQTSPIQGTKENVMDEGHWWILYQPTNFKIGNAQLGSREQFKSMCQEAEKYGIKIIVDVVANHTANRDGDAGKFYADGSVDPSIRDNKYFWHEHRGVDNWQSRWAVTHLGISLPDLNTENYDLQNKVRDFLIDCVNCGADGFRFDAAKHIELPEDEPEYGAKVSSDFWKRVLGPLEGKGLYFYGETLQSRDYNNSYEDQKNQKATNMAGYTKYMNVTASEYGFNIRKAVGFNNDVNVECAKGYNLDNGVEPKDIVTWVESHDNYAGDGKESTGMSDYQIKMAWSIIAARNASTPMFFARPNSRMGEVGSTLWKDGDIQKVNEFHNRMTKESEYLRTQGNKVMMVERGDKGMVITNLGGDTDINSETKLANGEYKDQISGRTFTVSNGRIKGRVNGGSIAVVYNKDQDAEVSSSKDSCKYKDSLELTLSAKNTDKATYSIDNGDEKEYNDGKTITIGEGLANGTKTSLTLKGYKDGKCVTKKYEYIKSDVEENTVAYFRKPSNWSSAKIYVYNGNKKVEAWPGTDMKSEGNDLYSYTLPDGWDEAYVLFTDGNNQVPAANKPGFLLKSGESKIWENGVWKDYDKKESTTKVYFENISGWGSPNIYVYDKNEKCVSPWPGTSMKSEGNNLYSYEIPENLDEAYVIFNDGHNQTPNPFAKGFYIKAGEVKIYRNGSWTDYNN
ncbi:MAG: starch-binding protein, partial [Clostridiaceae bacterium]|nr:starch-binding protein [Clostridiaceae bacterium]